MLVVVEGVQAACCSLHSCQSILPLLGLNSRFREFRRIRSPSKLRLGAVLVTVQNIRTKFIKLFFVFIPLIDTSQGFIEGKVVSRMFRTFGLAERHPALAHAVMAPLIC